MSRVGLLGAAAALTGILWYFFAAVDRVTRLLLELKESVDALRSRRDV